MSHTTNKVDQKLCKDVILKMLFKIFSKLTKLQLIINFLQCIDNLVIYGFMLDMVI